MQNRLHESMLYEKLADGRMRCNVCAWRCVISPGHYGVCRARRNDGDRLTLLNYGLVSSMHADPIEKKPLAHFHPGTRVMSLGGFGCNFHCKHCQNWSISFSEPDRTLVDTHRGEHISPEQAIQLTLLHGCDGIAWTYNEPSIWLEYCLDSARLAKERGLYTVGVTNGFATPEAIDEIGPYLDAYRVDVKGFSDEFYRGLAKVHRWREVLDVTVRAKKRWGMHVEVVTNIIPAMNDDDAQLEGIARWILDALGPLTPWHVTAFHPDYRLRHLPPTPLSTLERAHDIGMRTGLKFVYVGNVPGHPYESTCCYSCGQLVIGRAGYTTRIVGLAGAHCSRCGADMNMRVASVATRGA